MALYIPHSILHLARLLYVGPETFGPYYVRWCTKPGGTHRLSLQYLEKKKQNFNFRNLMAMAASTLVLLLIKLRIYL